MKNRFLFSLSSRRSIATAKKSPRRRKRNFLHSFIDYADNDASERVSKQAIQSMRVQCYAYKKIWMNEMNWNWGINFDSNENFNQKENIELQIFTFCLFVFFLLFTMDRCCNVTPRLNKIWEFSPWNEIWSSKSE